MVIIKEDSNHNKELESSNDSSTSTHGTPNYTFHLFMHSEYLLILFNIHQITKRIKFDLACHAW